MAWHSASTVLLGLHMLQICCGASLQELSRKGYADTFLNVKAQADQMQSLRASSVSAIASLSAGGHKAEHALTKLLFLADAPNAIAIYKAAGVEAAAARLMKSPSSSDKLQRLAGSIITRISGMPV